MKSLVPYVTNMLADARMWCGANTHRDSETIAKRVEHEGLSFLTIGLPSFSSSFLQALERGWIDSTDFPGFRRGKQRFPLFLRGLLCRVFDGRTGLVLDDPDSLAIYWIQQICCAFKKLEADCTLERKEQAYVRFEECENEVREWSTHVEPRLLDDFRLCAATLFGTVLSDIDRKISRLEHVPKHGPGATADKLTANARYWQVEWAERLQPFFPADAFISPNLGESGLSHVDFIEPGRERPVRVVLVPKTLKTPRVIAIEPAAMQYAQQSILELLVPALEKKYPRTLGFTDQTVNQVRAKEASRSRVHCTFDLSEASDRVSNLLVHMLLCSAPSLHGAVQACRTKRADVRGKVIDLAKFASMGSALCFPIEAMVFLTVLRMADCKSRRVSAGSRVGLSDFLRNTSVYGDDLIFPARLAPLSADFLTTFGLKVNQHKSFVKSNFRESCGGDFFNGIPVKPVYYRRIPEMASPRDRRISLVSLVSTRNQLYEAGAWSTATFLDGKIRKLIPFPNVQDDSPIVGRKSFLGYSVDRYSPTLHRPEVRGLTIAPRSPDDSLDGYGALMKYFLKRGEKPREEGHLLRYGRPRSVHTKIAWATPY